MDTNKIFKWEQNKKHPIIVKAMEQSDSGEIPPPDWFTDWLDSSGTDYPIKHFCSECNTEVGDWRNTKECECKDGVPNSMYVCNLCGEHIGNDTRDDYFHLLISHEDAIIIGRLSR